MNVASLEEDIDQAQDLRVAIGRVARRLRQLYAGSVTMQASFTQLAVLLRLERDGSASPSALAAGERVTSQAIAAVVRDLEQRSLVGRTRDPSDGRGTMVTVTDAGRRLLRDRDQVVMDALVRTLVQSFTVSQRQRLHSIAPLLNHLADSL